MEVHLCSKCEWKSLLSLDYGSLEWMPPCPRCGAILEGLRIVNAKV